MPVDCVAFSPNGKLLASAGRDLAIWVWDVETGSALFGPLKWPHSQIESLVFSPDGKCVVTGSMAGYLVWDAQTWDIVAGPFSGVGTIGGFSYDGKQFISGGNPENLGIFDTSEWECQPNYMKNCGNGELFGPTCFFPDGKRIITSKKRSSLQPAQLEVWDVETREQVFPAFATVSGSHWRSTTSVAFSADGLRIVTGCDFSHSTCAEVRVWHPERGVSVVGPLTGHKKSITSVAISPDAAYVMSGSEDNTVRVWKTKNEKLVAGPFKGHNPGRQAVAFSPDGARFAFCHKDNTIRIHSVE